MFHSGKKLYLVLDVLLCQSVAGFFFFIHSYVHTFLGSFLPPQTLPYPSTSPFFQAEPVLPFSPNLLKRRHKHNKKDIAFLLVEIRTPIQRDS
jgi:hypothetical protein